MRNPNILPSEEMEEMPNELLDIFRAYCRRHEETVDRVALFEHLKRSNFSSTHFLRFCANYYLTTQEFARAAMYFSQLLSENPEDFGSQLAMYNLRSYFVARWHFTMLNDVCRNRSYQQAICRLISQHRVQSLLDIGCGSGILSMIACDGGVEKVFACDCNQMMAQIATEVVSQNNMGERIKIISHSSTAIDPSQDLESKVDAVVTEVMDSGLYGESIVSTIYDAKQRLLKSDGFVIPSNGEFWGYLAQCDEIRQRHVIDPERSLYEDVHFTDAVVSSTCAFAIAQSSYAFPADPYASEKVKLFSSCLQLTDPFLIDSVNFNSAEDLRVRLDNFEKQFGVQLTTGGRVDAIVCWFVVDLFDGIKITSAPVGGCPSWEQAVFPIYSQEALQSGTEVKIQFSLLYNAFVCSVQPAVELDKVRLNVYSPKLLALIGDTKLSGIFGSYMRSTKAQLDDVGRILDLSNNPMMTLVALKELNGTIWTRVSRDGETVECLEKLCGQSDRVKTFAEEDEEDVEASEFTVLICCPPSCGGELKRCSLDDILYYRLRYNIKRVIPEIVEVYALLVESEELEMCTHVVGDDNTLGYKIQEQLNPYATILQRELNLNHLRHVKLSLPFRVMLLDLEEDVSSGDESVPDFVVQTSRTEVEALTNGSVNAVVFWFVMRSASLSTESFSTAAQDNHYDVAACMVSPFQVDGGQMVRVKTSLHSGTIFFEAQPTE